MPAPLSQPEDISDPSGSAVILTMDDSSSEISYEEVRQSDTVRTHPPLLRHRSVRDNIEDGFVVLEPPENEVEVKKMEQNYMFGFKKWKAHVTVRPFEERSDAVKSLYTSRLQAIRSTYVPGNITYTLLIGWWVALVYLLIAAIMAVTIIGWPYAKFCCKLARYFLWPFGKFVKEATDYELEQAVVRGGEHDRRVTEGTHQIIDNEGSSPPYDGDPLGVPSPESSDSQPVYLKRVPKVSIWRRPATYLWVVIAGPIVLFVHSFVIIVTGLLVVLIPVSKLYLATLKKLFLMPPEKIFIDFPSVNHRGQQLPLEVVMCIYQAFNVYFYKYTVDGMNIIITNMLVFVLFTLCVGYIDLGEDAIVVKFVFGAISIIPLAHYIGFAITSISSQSRHVVGAFLNALFGSFIEIYIYISTLLKGKGNGNAQQPCYPAIVKSALTGSLLATMLFIPGLCMVVGGLKHKEQAVNVRSASVSSTLLFISVAGAFSPTMFAITYGGFQCMKCDISGNGTLNSYECQNCRYTVVGMPDEPNFYNERVLPIVLSIAVLLPMAYVIGLAYSLVTHAQVLENHFKEKEREAANYDNTRLANSGQHSSQGSGQYSGHHARPVVLWGRIKSVVILIVSTVAMAFCAEVAVGSLEFILKTENNRITETFIGVTVIAVVPEIPEIINGIQFALKNNINLSLEIGSSIAVQVCLLQIPVLVVADLILELNFRLLFNNLHFWSVILSVIIVNYTFVDGKSDYFQGSMLCIVYFILLIMYFFAPEQICRD